MTDADTSHLVRVGSLDELKAKGCLVVSAGRHGVAVFWHEGRAWAVDNRCPHMGFPLSRGTVREGLLTCHWHHARFDLASGGTLDPFAGDVQPYATLIRDGDVFVEVGAGRGANGPVAPPPRAGAGGPAPARPGQGHARPALAPGPSRGRSCGSGRSSAPGTGPPGGDRD